MIDSAAMEDYIRQANPIPHLDDLDADELARFVDATRIRSAVAMQEPGEPSKRPAPATTPPRHRRAWAFAAAFLLPIATIAAIWVLRPGGVAVDVVEESTPSIDVESLEWTRSPLSEVFGDSGVAIAAITPGGPGFVAVGAVEDDAAVWTSPDALTWTRVNHDPEVLLGYGSIEIQDVTVGGPGLVAVGELEAAPGVWTSPDGFSWSRVPTHDLSSPDGNSRSMRSVATGGPGLVAVGIEHVRLEGTWNHTTVGRVWTSPDGSTWTQVPHDPDIFGNGESSETRSSIDRVISGGPGVVAIGVLNGDAAVWTSRDGLSWTATTEGLTWTSTAYDGGRISGVTAGGPGLVAVGAYELDTRCTADSPLDCFAAVWTSADGISWNPVPHNDAVFGGGPDKQGMHSITTIGTDLVAVGTSVWISKDGINWTRSYHDPDFVPGEHSGMGSVFAAGETLIAIGEAAIDTNYAYIATER